MKIRKVLEARVKLIADAWNESEEQVLNDMLFNGLSHFNKTKQEWLKGHKEKDLGAGIFLRSGKTKRAKRTIVKDITYKECIKLGKDAISIQWVPYKICSFRQLKKNSYKI